MTGILKNPLYIYVIGFLFVFVVYNLNWSGIYPNLSLDLKIFFGITFLFFLLFGILIDKLKLIKRTITKTKVKLLSRGLKVVYFLYCIEILYEQEIPLITKILGNSGVHYQEFGIPILHGLLISLNSFLIAHTFAVFKSTNNRKILKYNILLYLPAVLILNRSILVLGALTSLFIYIHHIDKIRIKTIIRLLVLCVISLYFFGILGNLRSGGDYIYTTSEAKKSFLESSIPGEYYWTYLYAASPLANFQNTINKKNVYDYDFKGFVFYENLPKIVSKNLGEPLGIKQRDLARIVPWLTVGTTYAKSYSYIAWFGPYIMFIYNLFIYLMIIVFFVPKKSSYHTTTNGILSVIVLMSVFSNMLIVTGISFQLIFCVLFSLCENKKWVIKSV